jgi:hypothetical protein
MSFFGGLDTEKYDRQYSDRQLVGRIAEYFKPQVKRLSVVSALVVAIAGVGAALPVVVSRAVDLVRLPVQGEGLAESQSATNLIAFIGIALLLVGDRHLGPELGASRAGRPRGRRCGSGTARKSIPCRSGA